MDLRVEGGPLQVVTDVAISYRVVFFPFVGLSRVCLPLSSTCACFERSFNPFFLLSIKGKE